MSSVNKDNFTSSFPIWMFFISYLILLSRTCSTMSNRNDILDLFLCVEEKHFDFKRYVVACGLFICGLYSIEIVSFYLLFLVYKVFFPMVLFFF